MHSRVKSTMAASAWRVVSPSDCGTQLLSSMALLSVLRASESLRLAASRGTDGGEGITVLNCFAPNCSHSTSHHSSRGHTWMQGGWEVRSSFRWWLPHSSKLRWGSLCFEPSSLKTLLFLVIQVIYQMKSFLPPLHRTNPSSHWGPRLPVCNSALALHCTCCIQHTTGVQEVYTECIFLHGKGSLYIGTKRRPTL